MGSIFLQLVAVLALCFAPARSDWLPGTATFYGGADGSGTMEMVKCWRSAGVRFTINGFNYFELVLVTNVAGSGSVASMSVKGSSPGWIQMSRNWGANWQCLAGLAGQALSFTVNSTGGQTIVFDGVVPAGWSFGQTYSTYKQFDY
uniref:Expansin-like CBD domain-containing protein n=1 Tax=Oryza brachyantha TaxID=4533 RepID=J3LK54_ORYBR